MPAECTIKKLVPKGLQNCVLGSVDGTSLHHSSALRIPNFAFPSQWKKQLFDSLSKISGVKNWVVQGVVVNTIDPGL